MCEFRFMRSCFDLRKRMSNASDRRRRTSIFYCMSLFLWTPLRLRVSLAVVLVRLVLVLLIFPSCFAYTH